MKNFELFSIKRKTVSNEDDVFGVASIGDNVYVIKTNGLYVIDIKTGFERCISTKKFQQCVTSVTYLTSSNQLWFVANSELIFVTKNDDSHELKTILTEFKVEAAVWSPCEDSIAIATSEGAVGVYTVDLKNLSCKCLGEYSVSEDLKNDEFVTVGWGSKESQFRGSEGKYKKEFPTEVKEVVLDESPRITWDGKGDYFAVNYFKENRMFKVFTSFCEPKYQCEFTVGLLPCIAWNSKEDLIACAEKSSDSYSISLFERNGLRRTSFELQDNVYVEDIKWDVQGEVLIIHQKEWPHSILNFYVVSNCYWSLKQSLKFHEDHPLAAFYLMRCDIAPVSVSLVTKHEIIMCEFKLVYHVASDADSTVCANLDGKRVKIVDFNKRVVAPPNCSQIIEATASVNFVIFQLKLKMLVLIDCNYCVYVYKYEQGKFVYHNNFQIDHMDANSVPLRLHHFTLRPDGQLLFTALTDASKDNLCSSEVLDESNHSYRVIKSIDYDITFLGATVDNRFVSQSDNIVSIHSEDEVDVLARLLTPALHIKLTNIKGSPCLITLSHGNTLSVNNAPLSVPVTSFVIHDDYLLMTTFDNLLACLRLIENGLSTHFTECYSRPIETGALLVAAIAGSSNVILQMPRGNLEIIQCRLIAADKITKLIANDDWLQAANLIRLEKLNMNLLVDIDSKKFFANFPKIMEILNDTPYLNQFLQEITDDNVLMTNKNYKSIALNEPTVIQNKRLKICEKIKDYLKTNSLNVTTAIIASLMITKGKKEVIDSMNCISEVFGDRSVAEEALKTLKQLVPDENLFNVALSLYDLQLAVFVAEQSNMDPKEYEPFIAGLKQFNEGKRRFEINDFLENYPVASMYLVDCTENVQEVIDYMQTHETYTEVYNLSHTDTNLFKPVSRSYANYLRDKKRNVEAATVYECAGLYNEAIREYLTSLRWKEALHLMKVASTPMTTISNELHSMAEKLINAQRYQEACYIYEKYLSDYEQAVGALLLGNHFHEALQFARTNCRLDLIETEIIPAIKAYYHKLYNKFNSNYEEFNQHKIRLAQVREQKLAKASNPLHLTADESIDVPDDLFSDAGSVTTKKTRSSRSHMSTLSSRNRRKEERKKQNIRAGSFYEDIALIRTMYLMIVEAFTYGPDTRQFCLTMMLIQHDSFRDAVKLQKMLLRLQQCMQDSLHEIWPPNFNLHGNDAEIQSLILQQNIDHLDIKFRSPPTNLDMCWKSLIFDTVDLLEE